jgi:hypothetical protein
MESYCNLLSHCTIVCPVKGAIYDIDIYETLDIYDIFIILQSRHFLDECMAV